MSKAKLAVVALVASMGCKAAIPPPSEEVVELREAGSEPRRAIGYHPKEHVPNLRFGGDGGPVAVVEWNHAGGDGFRFQLSRLEGGDPGGEMEHLLATAKGAANVDEHGRARLGETKETRFGSTPFYVYALAMYVVPLPREPVGVGARWHVHGPVAATPGGASDADYTLTALTTDGAEVSWTEISDAPLRAPGTLRLTTHGTATIAFDDVIPTSGDLLVTPDHSPREERAWLRRGLER